jgi:hypothetical protein
MKTLVLVLAAFGFITVSTVKTAPPANDVANQKYKECIDACNASISSCNKMHISRSMKDKKMDKCVLLSKKCDSNMYLFQ